MLISRSFITLAIALSAQFSGALANASSGSRLFFISRGEPLARLYCKSTLNETLGLKLDCKTASFDNEATVIILRGNRKADGISMLQEVGLPTLFGVLASAFERALLVAPGCNPTIDATSDPIPEQLASGSVFQISGKLTCSSPAEEEALLKALNVEGIDIRQ